MTKPLPEDRVQSIIDVYVDKKNINNVETYKVVGSDSLTIIDLELTKGLVKKELAIELLEMLCEQLPTEIKLMKEAYSRNGIEDIRALFHKMKGGLGYCGVPRLRKAADEVHDEVKNVKFVNEIEPLFENFYREADVFIQTFQSMKGSL